MKLKILVNLVGFELAWLMLVWYNDRALLAGLALLGLHFWLIATRRYEWQFVAVVALAGYAVDSVNTATSLVAFDQGGQFLAPIWLLVLWLLFATTLSHSLRWLLKMPALAMAAGALAGPFTYWAGVELGAGTLPRGPLPAVLALLIQWPLLMLGFSRLQQWYEDRERV